MTAMCPKNEKTVKLGFKDRLNKEQFGKREPFPVTNMPVNKMALVKKLALVNKLDLVNYFVMTKKFLNYRFDCTCQSVKVHIF